MTGNQPVGISDSSKTWERVDVNDGRTVRTEYDVGVEDVQLKRLAYSRRQSQQIRVDIERDGSTSFWFRHDRARLQ